ncbi:MAG: hypothetical protein HC848_04290 [Limnobacter sp.]|nr:hypothetical protein [Limnobacter sp.]
MNFTPHSVHLLVRAGLLALAVAATGCATHTAHDTSDFAHTGTAYTQAARQVNAVAKQESLAFSARVLPSLPRKPDVLAAQSQAMRERVALSATVDTQLGLLENYFRVLGNLASNKRGYGSEKANATLARLAYQMGNQPMGMSHSQSEGLAKVVVHVAQNHALKETLKRDGQTVYNTLAVLVDILAQQADWLRTRQDLTRQVAYRDEVEKPFLAGETLGKDWQTAWAESINPRNTLEAVEKAQSAANALLASWKNLLETESAPELAELQTSVSQLQSRVFTLTLEAP